MDEDYMVKMSYDAYIKNYNEIRSNITSKLLCFKNSLCSNKSTLTLQSLY